MQLEKQIEKYNELGYFIVDDAVEPEMLDELEAGCRRYVEKTSTEGGPEGTELIDPRWEEPVFSQYMESPALQRYVHAFVGTQLRLGWAGAFRQAAPYDCGWHRDTGGQDKDTAGEAELEILSRYRKNLFRWHLALVDDPCLWVVSGSHKRCRTEQEREVLINDVKGDIDGQQKVDLVRGQTMFWNGNLIHRGRAPDDLSERLTLHAGMIRHCDDDEPEDWEDQFKWRMEEGVRAGLSEGMRIYYDRWLALQKKAQSGAVPRDGHSQE